MRETPLPGTPKADGSYFAFEVRNLSKVIHQDFGPQNFLTTDYDRVGSSKRDMTDLSELKFTSLVHRIPKLCYTLCSYMGTFKP